MVEKQRFFSRKYVRGVQPKKRRRCKFCNNGPSMGQNTPILRQEWNKKMSSADLPAQGIFSPASCEARKIPSQRGLAQFMTQKRQLLQRRADFVANKNIF
ncbi:MAG: hypothetical protein Q4C56_09840 [Peptococcaceae bacterium]|nr:hypothetical protein [Peptococcaceae bacterium]